MPISLDTYKYLKDEEFLLVSEYIKIESEKPSENKITFTIDKSGSE